MCVCVCVCVCVCLRACVRACVCELRVRVSVTQLRLGLSPISCIIMWFDHLPPSSNCVDCPATASFHLLTKSPFACRRGVGTAQSHVASAKLYFYCSTNICEQYLHVKMDNRQFGSALRSCASSCAATFSSRPLSATGKE